MTWATDMQLDCGTRDVAIGLCLAVLVAACLYVGLTQHPSSFDDAYITYRYARNIAVGRGFVYNAGQPVLGTTTPLYALLLAGLSLLSPDIPRLSHVISAGAWAVSVPLIFGIARSGNRVLVGLVAASLLATNALFLNVLGMETTLYVLIILLTFYLYVSERPSLAALCAGLAFLTRWDGILVVGVLLAAQALKEPGAVPRAAAISALVIVPWLVYSQLTFGSIFPNTFFAKSGQGWKSGLGAVEIGSFPQGLVKLASAAYRENPLFLLPVGLSIAGAYAAVRDRVTWWPVLLWTGAYFAGYTVLGVLQFPWYYPPLVPAFALLIGLGVEDLVRLLPKKSWMHRAGLAFVLTATCLVPSADWLFANRRLKPNPRVATYRQVGEWLRNHTKPESTVAAIEIGVIGFYADREIVDTMGLVSPEMVGHLETWLQTLQFAINHYWPDYGIVLEGTAWGGIVRQPWFQEAYGQVQEVQNAADPDAPVRIYRRMSHRPLDDFALTFPRNVVLGDSIALRQFAVAEESVEPGGRLHAQAVWRALEDIEVDYVLNLDLVSAATGQRHSLREGAEPMRGGNPTHLWRAGDRIVDEHTLSLPEGLEPGPYLLELQMTLHGTTVTATGPDGSPVDHVTVGPIGVGQGLTNDMPSMEPVGAAFHENVSIAGYTLGGPHDDSVEITLYWEARAPVLEDYTVFVHLMSPDGELVAQSDSPPALPTTMWVPGTLVRDSHRVMLPPDAIGRSYEIRTGLYLWPDLERLPVLDGNGYPAVDDALSLGAVSFRSPKESSGSGDE